MEFLMKIKLALFVLTLAIFILGKDILRSPFAENLKTEISIGIEDENEPMESNEKQEVTESDENKISKNQLRFSFHTSKNDCRYFYSLNLILPHSFEINAPPPEQA